MIIGISNRVDESDIGSKVANIPELNSDGQDADVNAWNLIFPPRNH